MTKFNEVNNEKPVSTRSIAHPVVDVHPQKLNIRQVTASSSHPGPYACENVLNGRMGQDGGADWSTHNEGPGAWIQLDLGESSSESTAQTTVTRLKFAGRVRDDKFKNVRLSFDNGSSRELEFPDDTCLNSFDISPPVTTTFVRITCLTCYNTSHPNRGAQAIELWGFRNAVQAISVHGTVVEKEEDIPVITFRHGDDDDDICVIIDGALNKSSTMESVMESEDVCRVLGIIGLPSEYKFVVKRKQESSPIPLRWDQFRSMTVHTFSHLQNIDEDYLVTVKEKSSRCKVDEAKLEDLREKVLAVNKIVDDLTKPNPEHGKTIPCGNYFIKTTDHEPSLQVAGWGLAAWQRYSARSGLSSWVATHENSQWQCKWSVTAGARPNTYRIKTHWHSDGGQPAGWGLSAWHLNGGRRNNGSSKVIVHGLDKWHMDWEIVPGKKDGTWRILTTDHALGGQAAGWGLSSWGPMVGDTRRSGVSSWVHVHKGDHWPMDWVFERVLD